MSHQLVIGTRGSQLALWQANHIKSELERNHPGLEVNLKTISTTGDRILDVSLPKLGEQGKGLFTKELEEGLFEASIDIAVHSLKDLPTELPPGLHVSAICEREDVRDALVTTDKTATLADLPEGARIGTSSLRRQAQLKSIRSDFVVEPIRGNVDTRLRKLDEGRHNAIVLASAGLIRLGHRDRITQFLDEKVMLSAVGQGALAIESRIDDSRTNQLLEPLNHSATRAACQAERAFLKGLGGGCLVPIAALGRVNGDLLELSGLVASPDGARILRGSASGRANDPELLGLGLADDLLSRGASEILGYR